MNIQIRSDDITNFVGDAIIIPCDSELTYKKIGIVEKVISKGGQDLINELSAIGYCEVGNTVIVKGYGDLQVKNLIFMPISDHLQGSGTNYLGLHQSLRNAFILADLYQAKSIALGGIKLNKDNKQLFQKIWDQLFGDEKKESSLTDSQIEDIAISVSKDFEKSNIKTLYVYRYSR